MSPFKLIVPFQLILLPPESMKINPLLLLQKFASKCRAANDMRDITWQFYWLNGICKQTFVSEVVN